MLLLSHLEPVVSTELTLGNSYILLSEAQEQIYILKDCDVEYIKIFGRPVNYGLYSCFIEEIEDSSPQSAPFRSCSIPGMYKHDPHRKASTDLVIDWIS